jgi:hypothetical protein
MSEVVIKLPVRTGRETQLFGAYLDRFMADCSAEAERLAPFSDAPYLMVHSHPLAGHELKVLTFQHHAAARAFSNGWERTRSDLNSRRDIVESAKYA